jgi:hypothetical protein
LAVSSSDFIVPPAPYTATDIGYTDRMTPGTSKTVTISTATKIGLVLFDGMAGQRVSLKAGTGMTSSVKLLSYNANVLGTVSVGVVEAFIDVVTLPINATYTIVVDPVGSATGSLTLTLYDVPADVTGSITAGGSAETVATTIPGQNGRLTFTGSAGQRVSLKVGTGPVGTVSLVGPDRVQIASVSIPLAGTGFIDTQTLPSAGTYSIAVDYSGKNVGSVQLTLYTVPADISSTITAGGSAVAVAPRHSGTERRADVQRIGRPARERLHLERVDDRRGLGEKCEWDRARFGDRDGTPRVHRAGDTSSDRHLHAVRGSDRHRDR